MRRLMRSPDNSGLRVGYHGVSMRRTNLGLTLGLAAALVASLSCGRSATEVRFLDLVTEQRLTIDGHRLRPDEIVAVDETWVAVTLEPGAEIRADFDLFDHPSLTLAGCLECGDGVDGGMTGALEGAVRTAAGREIKVERGFDAADGWWQQVIDLGDLADTRAELAVRADIPSGCVVRLRDATIRHLRRIPGPESAPRTQVLLISVDTLRRDGVGSFGGAFATPHLDQLAAESEIWTAAYAVASWTKPSHASLLTGFYPDTHRAILVEQGMDAAVPTLAERFRSAGFATSALVFDCTWLSPRWGFGKGFDSYRVTPWRAGRQAQAATQWVLDHRDRDFFFFLHTFEPHSDFAVLPYEAPGISRRTIADQFGVPGFGCRQGVCAANFVNALDRGEVPERPEDAKILRSTYDSGVSYLDDSLGALFEILRGSGVWDDLMVVVTSDHGEEFSDHGGFGHHTLYDEILRVPLIIKWPRGEHAGEVNSIPCSGVDIAPTLLVYAGLATTYLPGVDVRTRTRESPVFAGALDLEHAVVTDRFKGIFGGKQPARLFDLQRDPGERTNLADQLPETLRSLHELLVEEHREALALYRSFGPKGDRSRVELGERDRERLKAFGYLQ